MVKHVFFFSFFKGHIFGQNFQENKNKNPNLIKLASYLRKTESKALNFVNEKTRTVLTQ